MLYGHYILLPISRCDIFINLVLGLYWSKGRNNFKFCSCWHVF